ncbi:MAG: LysR family transcriptional regulator [Gammaproteobacteria bacterium]|nr:LysR family transcriptional regulator [Gammaproteobacteria bacterium]
MDIDLYRINLNLLVALNVLLQEKSVTKAANKLFITQAAMSKNLAQLRTIFKDEILIREKNYMVLTNYAEGLKPKLQQILEELRNLIVNGQSFDPSTSKRVFKIGMSDYISSLILPKLHKLLLKKAPGIKISIIAIDHLGGPEAFERGDFDLAVGKDFGANEAVNRQLLFNDNGVCIVGSKHRFAKKKNITLEEYLAFEHVAILRSDKPERPRLIDNTLLMMGVKRKILMETPYMEPIFQLVQESDRLIGSLPEKIAHHYQKLYKFHILPLPFEIKPMEYYLLWNHRFDNDLGHKWLREQIIG